MGWPGFTCIIAKKRYVTNGMAMRNGQEKKGLDCGGTYLLFHHGFGNIRRKNGKSLFIGDIPKRVGRCCFSG